MKWRTGKSLGRTLYLGDTCVGMVDTPALAAELVDAANGQHRETEATVPHQAVQRLLFVLHIYRGHSITHRGPSGCLFGCLFDAIELLDPTTAQRLRDGLKPGDLLDRDIEDPQTKESADK